MQLMLSLTFCTVLFGTAWGSCDNLPPYSSKCRAITPIKELDDCKFQGVWYLWASGDTTPYTCTNYHVKRTGPHSYHTNAMSLSRNGTVFPVTFEWNVLNCKSYPEGYFVDVTPEYYPTRAIEYVLDLDEMGMMTTYTCQQQEDGEVLEEVHVYTREKAANEPRFREVLEKNNLKDFPVKVTYLNCPPKVEM